MAADQRSVSPPHGAEPLTDAERLRRFEALSHALASATTMRDVAEVTVREACVAIGALAAIVMAPADDGQALSLVAHHGVESDVVDSFQTVAREAAFPICRAFASGKAEWFERVTELDASYGVATRTAILPPHAHALAAVPLSIEGQVVLGIGLGFARGRLPPASDRTFVQSLLDLCAQAFERARHFEGERLARREAERASARASRLASVAAELSSAISPGDVADVVLRTASETLGAYGGAVLLLDGEDLVFLRSFGYPNDIAPPGRRLAPTRQSPPVVAVRSGEARLYRSRDEFRRLYPDAEPLRERTGAESGAWMPLRAHGRILGAFGVTFARAQTLPADDHWFLEALADHCAQAVERARLYEQEHVARTSAELLSAVLEVGEAVAGVGDREGVLTRLTEHIVPRFADWCSVYLVEGGHIALAAALHRDAPVVSLARGIRARRPVDLADPRGIGAVIRTGVAEVHPELDPELRAELARTEDERQIMEQLGFRSVVIVPLIAGERTVGAMSLASTRPELRYDAAYARLAEKLASRAALALDNARLIGELRQYAETERSARESAQRAALRMRILAEASRAFSEARLDVHLIATSLATLVSAYLADGCAVLLVSDDGTQLEPVATRHAVHERKRAANAALGVLHASIGDGIIGQVVSSGESRIRSADNPNDKAEGPAGMREYFELFDQASIAAVPLRLGDRVIGAVGATRDEGPAYDADDVAIVQDLADRAAVALANARLHAAEQLARKHVERLQSVTSALGEAVTPEQVADVILDSVMQELGGDLSVFYELADDEPSFVARRGRNLTPELARTAERLSLDREGLAAEAYRTRAPFFIEAIEHYEDRFPEAARAAGPWMQLGAFAVLPLVVGAGVVHGIVLVGFRAGRSFSAVDRAFAMNLAEQSAQALERARLYAAERAAKREAETASRLKDEFLATVSHELRTPLNAILGWSSLLRSGRLDQEALDRAIATIERNARTQARLVDDVLDVSRIISGKLTIRAELVDVGAVLNQALDVVRPAALAKEVTIETDVAPDLRLVGDPDRLQQVYWNVLFNAVKFTPRTGRIFLKAESAVLGEPEGAEEVVRVTVTDTGLGVRPEFLAHVFEPFRQADGSTTRSHGGLGLGLSIARRLVQLHGGEIHAASEGEGCGATFTITLPLTTDAPPVGAPKRARPVARLKGLDILVVDDDEDARELTAMVLEGEGADVRTAASAREAIAAIVQHTPGVLVCDIGMPEEDGLSLLPRARAAADERGESFTALAFTAYADAEHAELVAQAGFDAHITKPIDAHALVSAVARLAFPPPPATSSSALPPG